MKRLVLVVSVSHELRICFVKLVISLFVRTTDGPKLRAVLTDAIYNR